MVSWREQANCKDTDTDSFYPEEWRAGLDLPDERWSNHNWVVARRVCLRCPVRMDCLTEALMFDERYGIWGGFGVRQRRELEKVVGKIGLGALVEEAEKLDARIRKRERRMGAA